MHGDGPLFEHLLDDLDPREREELAARLALAANAVEPGPAVRERVMARVARAEAVRSARAIRRWQAAAALAAAAALGALLTWSGRLADEPPPAGPEAIARSAPAADAAADEVEELEALLAEQDEELVALERELTSARDALSVLTAEKLERLDLSPADEAHVDATARVYWDWDEYSCYFVAQGLPATDQRRYALWLFTDHQEVLLAGRFAAPPRERASFFAMLPKEMGKVVRAVVTEEPEPGDEAAGPTGRVLLEGGREI